MFILLLGQSAFVGYPALATYHSWFLELPRGHVGQHLVKVHVVAQSSIGFQNDF